ncbi:PREDICTED: uncharacterized protein LOC105557635 [Vollenhovia emeryi]|uniref:uncharacterized protein LOC105557635 n=1 Tax=Vollenhovia emeryi TaxID=411798 RepID=UPI0005F4D4D0|nr:PREDICTED: uncharacterized protein LOC105557635 [Vollenhovia emeryi]
MATLNDLTDFLEKRCTMLEMTDRGKGKTESGAANSKKAEKKLVMTATTTSCGLCKRSHLLFKCDKFLKLSPNERYQQARQLKLCTNCLKEGHIGRECRSSACRKCSKKHNTLLHKDSEGSTDKEKEETSNQQNSVATHHSQVSEERDNEQAMSSGTMEEETSQAANHCAPRRYTRVVLSTAQVYVSDVNGAMHRCRALLDPGSQSNLITEDLVKRLQIASTGVKYPVVGVNQARVLVNKSVNIQLTSTTSNYKAKQECLVLPVITDRIPQVKLPQVKLRIPHHLSLADPEFDKPGDIDVLIGAGLFWKVLINSRRNHFKQGWPHIAEYPF